MKLVHLTHPYNIEDIPQTPIVLALGFFDGVHLGHQDVIRRAKQESRKRDIPLVVMTFDRHPKILYTGIDPESVDYLSIIPRKEELMAQLGVDMLYVVEFSADFGHQSPTEFVENYIVNWQAAAVVAGFDYTYGPKESANMHTLVDHAQGRFDVIEVPELSIDQAKVGSSTIITELESGSLEEANTALGYPYQQWGEVVHGFKRGRQMGYPTANIKIIPHQVIPKVGVYVTSIYVEGEWHQSMTSIGYNVTFSTDQPLSIESYILDFDRMIYGENVRLRWHHYLRGEIKFDGMEGLIQQLDKDIVDTANYFEHHPLSQQMEDINE